MTRSSMALVTASKQRDHELALPASCRGRLYREAAGAAVGELPFLDLRGEPRAVAAFLEEGNILSVHDERGDHQDRHESGFHAIGGAMSRW
jgi:hypothetical protein